ncbi:TIGR00725 family protein, partial [Candidatus Woesearchaeota archaeon]
GSDVSHVSQKALKVAYQVGGEIAKAGAVLVTGGGEGVMKAASQGAKEHNGLTVGILPGKAMNEANEYVDIVIPTGIGYSRDSTNANSSHGAIIVEGGVGTLSELTYCYLNKIPTVVMTNVPGVGVPYVGKYMDNRRLMKIKGAKDPAKAVAMIMAELKRQGVFKKVKSIEHIRHNTFI